MLRYAFCAAALLLSVPAAADPFDDARYYVGIKNTAQTVSIIESGAFDVNMQNEEGYTLLHFAAEAGDMTVIRALLDRGADPTIKTPLGMTPYDMAYATTVKAELRKAADAWSGAGSPAVPPGTVAAAGEPALASAGPAAPAPAAANGMCARAIANPASSSRSSAMRPFLAARDAIWYNHPDELAGLVEDCVAVTDSDEYGWTLLHHAADRDRVALARILVEHGATSGARNKDGKTAAQLATSAEMRALLGPADADAAPATAEQTRSRECRQLYEADAALASDSTGRMSAMRRWQKCLDTGTYW